MKFEQVFEQIAIEKQVASRYRTRLIFVESLAQYDELVGRLRSVCDLTIHLADFCPSEDTYPSFERLEQELQKHPGKLIVLLGMGEYLRFRIKKEVQPELAKFPSFWKKQQAADAKTRIFVPMFAAYDLFEQVDRHLDDRQVDHLWRIDAPDRTERPFSITVYSATLKDALKDTVFGLKTWLQEWDRLCRDEGSCAVVTGLYVNVENVNSRIQIRVVNTAFDYVCSMVQDSKFLRREWLDDNDWAKTIPYLVQNAPFSRTIEKFLNVQRFEPVAIFSNWRNRPALERKLIWIWHQLNATNDYCGYVVRSAVGIEEIEIKLRDCILENLDQPGWVEERNQVLRAMGSVSFDKDYFERLDQKEAPIGSRLALLTFQTHEERAYALRLISEWLQQGIPMHTIQEAIRDKFRLLELYLSATLTDQPQVDRYFSWYRRQKLLNQMPDEIPNVDYHQFESRYQLLSRELKPGSMALWVDGMGVEWLPLLLELLKNREPKGRVRYCIGTAVLPTETQYNAQWEDFDCCHSRQWKRLDELAHKGVPDERDYFSCIDRQLDVIEDLADEAVKELQTYERVVITADHGTSRIAALAFHHSPAVSVPKNGVVKGLGRYCQLKGPLLATEALPFVNHVKHTNGEEYAVMMTHDHYSASGMAGWEIHGGMTPEEYLVPVVVLERAKSQQPIQYSLKEKQVYRQATQVVVELMFDQAVSQLVVRIGKRVGQCEKVNEKTWKVVFSHLEVGQYTLEVVANGQLLRQQESFQVKSKGITTKPDLLGDL